MSKEQGEESASKKAEYENPNPLQGIASRQTTTQQHPSLPATPPKLGDEPQTSDDVEESKPKAKRDHPSESTSPSTPEGQSRPRQVIAVSASKGPAAFFNLARKFLVTDDMCDLSALEGAIVSAVDAAHLLERSKLATIVRVQTSYVTVEPKRRKQVQPQTQPQQVQGTSPVAMAPGHRFDQPGEGQGTQSSGARRGSGGRELRRARIVITVKRTESYKIWLQENPLQAIMAGDGGDDVEAEEVDEHEEVEDEER